MSNLRIPLERPKTEALNVSFHALQHDGPTTVHTLISMNPGYEDSLNKERLLELGFKAQTDLKTGAPCYLTSEVLDRDEWSGLYDGITEFQFCQKSEIRNLKAVDQLVPSRVADLFVVLYEEDASALATKMSDITNSEVDDAALRDLVSDVYQNVYNKGSALAMIYLTGELVATDARCLKSKPILKNYNECLKTIGEYEIKSLASIVSTEYLRSVSADIPTDGITVIPNKAPDHWPDISVFSDGSGLADDLSGYVLDSIETTPLEAVTSELEKRLVNIDDADKFRHAKNVVIAMNNLVVATSNIKEQLVSGGFLVEDDPFHFEYFGGSLQLAFEDKAFRPQSIRKGALPEEVLNTVADQARANGSADLQLGAILHRVGWEGFDDISRVSVKEFTNSFKKKHSSFVFRFFDEKDPTGNSVGVFKLDNDTFISAPESKRLLLDSICVAASIKDVLQLHNEKHAEDSGAVIVDLAKNIPRINRAEVSVADRVPGSSNSVNLSKIKSLIRIDLVAEFGMDPSLAAEKAKQISRHISDGGLCVYGESRGSNTIKSVTSAEIFGVYNGNRRLAADACLRELTNLVGFTMGATPRVYDALEIEYPHAIVSLDGLNQRGEPSQAVKSGTDPRVRQDLGVVAGIPLKGLNKDQYKEASESLFDLKYFDLKEAASIKTLWTVRQKERLQAKGADAGLAYLELNYRNNFPAKCFDLSNLSSVQFYVKSLMNLRNIFSEEGATLDSVKADLKAWHEEFFPLNIDSEWRSSLPDAGPTEWSEHQRRMWASPIRGKSPFQAFIAEKKGNALQGWIKTAATITWDDFLKKSASTKVSRISWTDLPHLKHLHRTGPHNGDVLDARTPEEMLLQDFNVSGVEYGNWLNQKEASEHMFFAYNSMADLATAIGVDKRALSLGGQLGLAFGSRGLGGKGAAMAHFEPHNVAINLTRMKGAGSLAHEYAHALSNYFAKLVNPLGTDMFKHLSSGSVRRMGVDTDSSTAGNMRPELYQAWLKAYDAVMSKPSPFVKGTLIDSDFVTAAKGLDTQENRKQTKYWGTPVELFARAMERYFDAKLESHGISNNYLLRPDRFNLGGGVLYPSDAEMSVITPAMDRVIEEVKIKETQMDHAYLGRVSVPVMYSHDLSHSGVVEVDRGMLATMAINDIHRMLGDHTAILIADTLTDERSNPVAGSWDASKNVIRLASSVASRDTINHEAYHAAESKLLTASEIKMLDGHLDVGTPMYQDLIRVLDRKGLRSVINDQLHIPEERRAYAFQYFASGELNHKEPEVIGVFARLKELLANIYSALKGAGYTKPTELFRDLQAGELAHRSYSSQFERDIKHAAKDDQELGVAAAY